MKGRAVKLMATVPYCEKDPVPYVAKVLRRHKPGAVVLTVYVRARTRARGGCLGYDIGVFKWVRFASDPLKLHIYDGSTKPPTLRHLGPGLGPPGATP